MPDQRHTQDIAAQIAMLRARALSARRLAEDVFDDAAHAGLLTFAEECERRAAGLAAEAAPPPGAAPNGVGISPNRQWR